MPFNTGYGPWGDWSKEYYDTHGGNPALTAKQQRRCQEVRDKQRGYCACCGAKPELLQVHHLSYPPRDKFGEEEDWQLIGLCGTCHPMFERAKDEGLFYGDARGWAEEQRNLDPPVAAPEDLNWQMYHYTVAVVRRRMDAGERAGFFSTEEMKERDRHADAPALPAGRRQAQAVRL